MLFKAEERGTGEDWAEKIVCELAAVLGIPHVHYELALDTATLRPGVVSPRFTADDEYLAHGNSLLLALDPKYPADQDKKYKVRDHTIDAITGVLKHLAPPAGAWMPRPPLDDTSALDVFCGYTMLDAWVANQDRHHENWGAVFGSDKLFRLAPSYDHGAALARLLQDEERDDRLRTKDKGRTVAHYVRRARSAIYDNANDPHPMGLLETFVAFARLAPEAAIVWRERLHSVDEMTMARVLAQIPPDRISAIGREFTLQLLAENRRRLLANRPDET